MPPCLRAHHKVALVLHHPRSSGAAGLHAGQALLGDGSVHHSYLLHRAGDRPRRAHPGHGAARGRRLCRGPESGAGRAAHPGAHRAAHGAAHGAAHAHGAREGAARGARPTAVLTARRVGGQRWKLGGTEANPINQSSVLKPLNGC